ncbi:MAG TPA: peptide chain release factor N(5)-glutamine methyltransferase [Verrucomicrobiae bacterium]|nr:peptide chain release factor N(5)-glutamine methyltransferase [Verrucomicrobiae bacterium]
MTATGHRPQTIAQMLARGTVSLATRSDSPRADAALLLAYVAGKPKEWIFAHGEAFLSKAQGDKFASLCELRAAGTPIAYILGFAGFYGRDFAVSDKVLIPRPETEHLVEEALAYARERAGQLLPKQVVTLLDVGVGSGAIACTIAAELAQTFVEGTDISADAIKVAEHNAKRLNVANRCKFLLGDLGTPVLDRSYDVVIANLPYVPSGDLPKKPEPAGFEPSEALDGGLDGLDAYRRFLPQAKRLVKAGGLVLLEAAPPTIERLMVLVSETFLLAEIALGEDYGGRLRYVKVKAPIR